MAERHSRFLTMPQTPRRLAGTAAGADASPRESSLYVGSVAKAFQVLEAFRDTHREMSLAEIARAAQLDRSATQRIVFTLENLRYIQRLPNSNVYTLAPEVLRLSYNYLRSRRIIDRASPYLIEMTAALGETSNLHELDGHEIVFLARIPGQHLFNVDFTIGSRLPAVYSASGRAMLSCLSAAQRARVIADTPRTKVTTQTETEPDALLRHIAQAEKDGFAIAHNQTVIGDISVGAPITDHHGLPVGAINISVPATRWTIARVESDLLPHVLLASTSISKILDNI